MIMHRFLTILLTWSSHPDSDRVSDYDMKLMDIDVEQLEIPDTDYDARVTMPSAEFARIVRDLSLLGESVRIEVSKEGVRFISDGEAANGNILLRDTQASTRGKAKTDDEPEDEDDEEDGEKKVKKEKVKKEAGEDVEMDEDAEQDFKPKDAEEDEDEEEEEDEGDKSSKKRKKAPAKVRLRRHALCVR